MSEPIKSQIIEAISTINEIIWGPPLLILLLGAGVYLMIGLGFMPLRKLGYAFSSLWRGRQSSGEGDISAFNALMTALAATIGTGNIAGVATAIHLGGPGALFWMWCTALVGMATKYAEAVCAVHYREIDKAGNYVGGPMYYIKNGLGRNWLWLAGLFAFFGAAASFGIGNTVQANSLADVFGEHFGVPVEVTGVILALSVGLVIIGGIRWIAKAAGKLVPAMAVLYVSTGLLILILNANAVPGAIALILEHAFTPVAATGGFAGLTVWAAVQYGVARGVFSNEAGLGSAPIAHAAAATKSPVNQGVIAMLGTFIDTIVVCSITGLVLVIFGAGAWTGEESGAALSALAFQQTLPDLGKYIVAFSLALFAFTTILGWSFYGEKCVEYLFGFKAIWPFRGLWIFMLLIGAIGGKAWLESIWLIADVLNGLMALPNLIALLLLSPIVFKLTREYFTNSMR